MRTMLIRTRVVVALVAAGCAAGGGAAGAEVLTWEACVQEAAANHPDLVAARARVDTALASRRITASGRYPQIRGSVSGRTSDRSGGDRGESYSSSVSAEQLVYDWSQTSYGIKAAEANLKAAQYNYENTSATVRQRLRSAFVQLVRAQESLVITEEIGARRKENVEHVTLRYKAGREHKGSLLTAQANLRAAEYDVAQAKRTLAVSQRRLSKELGRAELVAIEAKGELEAGEYPAGEIDFVELAERTPTVKSLEAGTEAARYEVRSARANYYPSVSASASVGTSDSSWPPDEHEWSIGLSVSVPLSEGGRRKAQVAQARYALVRTQAEEIGGRDETVLTLEQRWTALEAALDEVVVQGQFLEAAEERAAIAQVQYSNGLMSFDNWTIIEDELVRSTKALLEARANALIAEAEWLQAQGVGLEAAGL